jgi:hypothetical protein
MVPFGSFSGRILTSLPDIINNTQFTVGCICNEPEFLNLLRTPSIDSAESIPYILLIAGILE